MTDTVLTPGAPADVGMDASRLERARDLCRGWVASGEAPSIQVLVARRGTVVLHEAFGVRCPGGPSLRLDSIFPISSCTKPFVAAALMTLVEDGLIGLNRPFVDYLPELDVDGVEGLHEARVMDLACHTAGIEDTDAWARVVTALGEGRAVPDAQPGQDPLVNATVHLLAGAPLAKPPGTAMIYSNVGYLLLGEIVRRAAGGSLGQLLRTRLFEPLGLRDTYFADLPSDVRAERRVFRAADAPGNEPMGWYQGIDSEVTDAYELGLLGVQTTAGDLARFAQMLLNRGSAGGRRVLSRASVRSMTTSQLASGVEQLWVVPHPTERVEIRLPGGGYGIGLYIYENHDRFPPNGSLASTRTFGHIGNGGSYFWVDPDAELVGVYLSVAARLRRDVMDWHPDSFMNAAHAAIVD